MDKEYIELEKRIIQAENYINNQYFHNLNEYEVQDIDVFDRQSRYLRLYHVSKIIYDKEEDSFKKLRTVLNSVSLFCNSAALIIDGQFSHVDIYLAVNSKNNIKIANELLHDSFIANFPGSLLELYKLNNPKGGLSLGQKCVSIANFIPSKPRKNDESKYNGLEKFVETMKGQIYTGIVLSKPLKKDEIQKRIQGFEMLYSSLSPLEKTTFSSGSNEGYTISKGVSDSISTSITNGISLASGVNQSINQSSSIGSSVGLHTFLNIGVNTSRTEGFSNGTTSSDIISKLDTYATGRITQSTESTTSGTTQNTTKEYKNKNIISLLSKIDKHVERMYEGLALGMWESSVYFIGDTNKTVSMAASTFSSLLINKESYIGNVNINIFASENKNTIKILRNLEFLMHPVFRVELTNNEFYEFKPVSYVNGEEVTQLFNLPKKSLNGIEVESIAEFGRNIHNNDNDNNIKLGNIYHMREVQENELLMDLNSFTSHCFITGSTGSGKSNTVYNLIEKIYHKENKVPFLVIEPAKGEYRDEFRKISDINLFSTNPLIDQMLRLNPFSFNDKIHILEHLDRLIEIFNGCWEMYAAMPAILKDAIEKAYVNKGWDLLNSIYFGENDDKFPTFMDVLKELPDVIKSSGYSGDTQSDYTGALVTRVKSMTNGIFGQIFCDGFEIDDEILFESNTIVDLSRVGSAETKSLLMGIIVLKLTEFRISTAIRGNQKLKHITVLEEAHNLLKNTKNSYSISNNNIVSKSVEMIVNSIAEMRTYGEGFVIVDQIPTSVDTAAIKNTNTKIIMRLPDKEDCDIAGHSIGLNENQIKEIPKLETGVAVVMQNNWHSAVLSKVDRALHEYFDCMTKVGYDNLKLFRGLVIKELINEYIRTDSQNIEKINQEIDIFNITNEKKLEMKMQVKYFDFIIRNKFDSVFVGKTFLKLSKSEALFNKAENILVLKNTDDKKIEYTEESIRKWNKYIADNISNYIVLDEENFKRLKQYIVYYRIQENRKIDYNRLYYQITIK